MGRGRGLRHPATDLPADSGRRARHGARNASLHAQRHKCAQMWLQAPPSRRARRGRGAAEAAGPPRPPGRGAAEAAMAAGAAEAAEAARAAEPPGRRGRRGRRGRGAAEAAEAAEAAGPRRFPVAVRRKSMRATERHGRPLRPPATDLPADSGRRARHGARNASLHAQRHKSRADVAARPRRLRRPGACRPHDHYYDSARRLRCWVTAPAVPSASTSYVAGSSASASASSGTTCSRTGNGANARR